MVWAMLVCFLCLVGRVVVCLEARKYRTKYPKCPLCVGRMLGHPHYPNLTECNKCRYLILKD